MQGCFFFLGPNLLKKGSYKIVKNQNCNVNDQIFHIHRDIRIFLQEDSVGQNAAYQSALPSTPVSCQLRIKSPLMLVGMPWFEETFRLLGADIPSGHLQQWEGTSQTPGKIITFELPFSAALQGERVALNLLRRASSVATHTAQFVQLARPLGIAILDTRKTTPGLRSLEKYAVQRGGGQNHRFHQNDLWMIKDNHKNFFGGIEHAVKFFEGQGAFYTPILVEIHTIEELAETVKLAASHPRIRHLMLDNFSPEQIREALPLKPPALTYEVSGGITLENIADYLIRGVDGISIGNLTAFPPGVDISLKYL